MVEQEFMSKQKNADRYFGNNWLSLSNYISNIRGNISLDTPMFTAKRYFAFCQIHFERFVRVWPINVYLCECLYWFCCNVILYGYIYYISSASEPKRVKWRSKKKEEKETEWLMHGIKQWPFGTQLTLHI